jgi:5-methylcytosine-specific restriction endonuclease McrA
MSANGSTRRWRALRREVIRAEPLCRLRLPGCTRLSTTADHIIPISVAPSLRYERSNLQGSCAHCNYARANTPISQLGELRSQTTKLGIRRAAKHIAAQREPVAALAFFSVQAGQRSLSDDLSIKPNMTKDRSRS